MNELQKKVLLSLLEEYRLECIPEGTNYMILHLYHEEYQTLGSEIIHEKLESGTEEYFNVDSLNKLAQKWIKEL